MNGATFQTAETGSSFKGFLQFLGKADV